jgi:ABC-type sugar transport system substrate-binding protein
MNRRQLLAGWISCATWLAAARAARAAAAVTKPPHILFLNPGEELERGTGQHWQLVSRFMAATAARFGMHLEVLYAERDHLLMLRHAETVAARSNPPDYVVIVNEKLAAQPMLHTLSHAPTKVLLIHNDLTDAQRAETGNERGAIANWIGTVTADAAHGSFKLMDYLCGLLGGRPARVIGITGDPTTPVSNERAQGVSAALARHSQDRMEQLVYGDWSFADGKEKTLVLLSRYPGSNIVWAANDSMTLGALAAVRERHQTIVVGGLGALPEAVTTVKEGELAAIVAGDQFIGACAMVLLYDYHHGVDFAQAGNARLKLDFLTVLNRENAGRFYDIAFNRETTPDFSRFSRYLQGAGAYNFDLQLLLGAASKAA